MKTAVCTIVSKNYLHFARTLMDSAAKVHPDWEPWVLLVDRVDGRFDPAGERFSVLEISDLPIPEKRRMLFRYSILELNTAAKPWLASWLFEARGYDRVVYLDPDISIYSPLEDVVSLWDAGALAVLTPHLTGRIRDELHPAERDILVAGTYNLGFIALARQEGLAGLLEYWSEKSVTEFAVDIEKGLFTDQKWIDLVPGLFPGVRVLRHEGYNVAYWNLPHRRVAAGDPPLVNGVPLVFFHFSGLDPANPERFSKHQNRYTLADLGDARPVVLDYCRRVLGNGYESCRHWPYAFGSFEDGSPVLEPMRRFYRGSPEMQAEAGENPFAPGALDFNRAAIPGDERLPPVTRMMKALWDVRSDLRTAFPDLDRGSRAGFARWFLESGLAEQKLPASFAEPLEEFLRRPQAAVAGAGDAPEPDQPAPPPAPPVARRIPLWARIWRAWHNALWALSADALPVGPSDSSDGGFRGFHVQSAIELEQGLAWMAPQAEVVLRDVDGGSITVEGCFSPDYLRAAGQAGTIALTFELGWLRIGTLRLSAGGPFEKTLRLPRWKRKHAILRIRSSGWFVPAEAGSSGDQRKLAVQIRRITCNGLEVVGFSRTDSSFDLPHSSRRMAPDLSGFYERNSDDTKHGTAWMAPRAAVRLPLARPGSVVAVSGVFHPDFLRRAGAGGRLLLRAAFDGTTLGSTTLEQAGPFRFEMRVPEETPRTRALLTLECNKAFVPVKMGLNPDTRTLAIRLSKVEVDGTAVLDFAREGTPFLAPKSEVPALGLNVVGYARNQSGIGQSVRLAAESSRAASLRHQLLDFRESFEPGRPGGWPPRLHEVNLFHVNADQVMVVYNLLGRSFFAGRYNVGTWHWELPELPEIWHDAFEPFQEIWAPSRFVMDALAKVSPIPVVHMPHGIGFRTTPGVSRADFGLPEGKFLVLVMYDVLSFQERKNPEAAVEAYRRAFDGREDVALVLKTMNSDSNPEGRARLSDRIAGIPGVHVIDRMLSHQQVHDLESLVDAYLSLHRSEGWGMNAAESMFLGKPVVATGWSGNMDFMSARNSCPVDFRLVELDRDIGPYPKGQQWAEPDVDHAAAFLRRLVDEPGYAERLGREAKATMNTGFSFDAAGRRMADRLAIIERLSA